MVIDFVIVTAPNPPGSMTLISPAAAVLEIAPANVLQGAVRLQGLTSSPTPDTHVRVACANAGALTMSAITMKDRDHFLMCALLMRSERRFHPRGTAPTDRSLSNVVRLRKFVV